MTIFSISSSGLRAAFRRQDVIANNLANLVTPGFRSSRADMVDIPGGGTAVGSISVRLTQGPLEIEEGLPFTLAVHGDGFFRVETPQGPRFTRAGSFHIDRDGRVVTSEGAPLAPEIVIPPDARSVRVGPDGTVSVLTAQGEVQTIGQITLSRFANPQGLIAEGSSLHAAGPASGPPAEGIPGQGPFGQIVFGALEGSNVDLGSEIVSEIVNRAFARANIAALRTQDEMLGTLLDLRR
jgi:flagellar basal-body rod protein FlgG